MISTDKSVPPPDLRIVAIDQIHPHETHDSQRSEPLLQILRKAEYLTNPPIVAPVPNGEYVVLDGANRYHCFRELGYDQLLVQVAPYDSGLVKLSVWQHIIGDWSTNALITALEALPNVMLKYRWDHRAVVQISMNNGATISLYAPDETVIQRNHALREIVGLYQRHASLRRTALHDPTQIWPLYTDAVALVLFPPYQPEDIIQAALERAYLPPGVSRHIIQGRALKLYYPLEKLYDRHIALIDKNEHLQAWVRDKLAKRQVRFYAESTYQFDE